MTAEQTEALRARTVAAIEGVLGPAPSLGDVTTMAVGVLATFYRRENPIGTADDYLYSKVVGATAASNFLQWLKAWDGDGGPLNS